MAVFLSVAHELEDKQGFSCSVCTVEKESPVLTHTHTHTRRYIAQRNKRDTKINTIIISMGAWLEMVLAVKASHSAPLVQVTPMWGKLVFSFTFSPCYRGSTQAWGYIWPVGLRPTFSWLLWCGGSPIWQCQHRDRSSFIAGWHIFSLEVLYGLFEGLSKTQ